LGRGELTALSCRAPRNSQPTFKPFLFYLAFPLLKVLHKRRKCKSPWLEAKSFSTHIHLLFLNKKLGEKKGKGEIATKAKQTFPNFYRIRGEYFGNLIK